MKEFRSACKAVQSGFGWLIRDTKAYEIKRVEQGAGTCSLCESDYTDFQFLNSKRMSYGIEKTSRASALASYQVRVRLTLDLFFGQPTGALDRYQLRDGYNCYLHFKRH